MLLILNRAFGQNMGNEKWTIMSLLSKHRDIKFVSVSAHKLSHNPQLELTRGECGLT